MFNALLSNIFDNEENFYRSLDDSNGEFRVYHHFESLRVANKQY